MSREDLLDEDGENRALRSFLMQYSCDRAVSVEWMCHHMELCGWGVEFVPEFARSHHGQNLTKAGAQIWIRHLLGMERRASPAAAVPDGSLPEPWGADFEAWLEVRTGHEVRTEIRAYVRAAVEADRAQRPENANQPLCDSALRAEPAGTGFLTIGWREALEKLRPDTTTYTHDTEIADAVLDEVIDALDDLEESQRCAAPHEQGNLGEMFIVAGGKWDGVRWVVENSDLATFMRSVLAAGAARQGGDGAPEAVSADRAQQGEPVAWIVGADVFKTREQAAANVRNPDLKPEPLYRAATKAAAPADAEIAMLARKLVEFYPDSLPDLRCGDEPTMRKLVEACRAAPVPDTGIPTAGEADCHESCGHIGAECDFPACKPGRAPVSSTPTDKDQA